MKTKIYSCAIFFIVVFLLIFQYAGNAQSVADLYEKYYNNSQNQHLKASGDDVLSFVDFTSKSPDSAGVEHSIDNVSKSEHADNSSFTDSQSDLLSEPEMAM